MSDDCGVPGYLLWRAANHWQKGMRTALSQFGVTPVQYLLLAGLCEMRDREGGPVKQAALARHCGSDPMMTSQVLRALQKAGLVARQAHDGDGRAMAIEPTPAGEELLAKADAAVAETDTQFHSPLGPEKEAFGDALRLLSGIRPRRRVKAVVG